LDEFQENRRRLPEHDDADEWETFFMRLQMLGIAIPADDDDDIDDTSYTSSFSSCEDSDEVSDSDCQPA